MPNSESTPVPQLVHDRKETRRLARKNPGAYDDVVYGACPWCETPEIRNPHLRGSQHDNCCPMSVRS